MLEPKYGDVSVKLDGNVATLEFIARRTISSISI